jgi:hypothetical protein
MEVIETVLGVFVHVTKPRNSDVRLAANSSRRRRLQALQSSAADARLATRFDYNRTTMVM